MLLTKELRTKNLKELDKLLKETKKDIEKLVQEVYKGKDKNIMKSRFLRKDIARINTLINEKKFLERINNG